MSWVCTACGTNHERDCAAWIKCCPGKGGTFCDKCGKNAKDSHNQLLWIFRSEADSGEMSICYQCQWTTEWPTEEGTYWFFGWTNKSDMSGRYKEPPKMQLVEVHKNKQDQITIIAGSVFVYKSTSYGKFMPAKLPHAPELE